MARLRQNRPHRHPALALAFLALTSPGAHAAAPPWTPREGAELIGTAAPAWTHLRWIQGGPLTLGGLRGKAVLLRFWTDECPYCTATAPTLAALDRRFRNRGLVVVAVHHPKSRAGHDPEVVRRAARTLGLGFAVGTDEAWSMLRAYGVGTHFKRFTSVTFLIDTAGVIRFVHDGGELHPGGGEGHHECDLAYQALMSAIEDLLPSRR